ncbi:hypothetical protein [Labedaea rhizosphaerae]|nr:hypothetical protein [Labedaea rhizosphaerae]
MSEQEEPPGAATSQAMTSRALVLLGSALALATSGVVSFLVLVFWPVLAHLQGLTAGVVFGVIGYVLLVISTIAAANFMVIRRVRSGPVAMIGCGTLIVGTVIAFGLLIAVLAGSR